MYALDPFFFQGGDPHSDAFMWFSFLDTPSNNSRHDDPNTYECQILVSWPYREGFKGREKPLDVPATGSERLALMKGLASGWAEPFRECVLAIPDGTHVQAIRLEDFVPRQGMWDNRQGRCTMVGDAAHAMTMCRFLLSMVAGVVWLTMRWYSSRRRCQSRHYRCLRPTIQHTTYPIAHFL